LLAVLADEGWPLRGWDWLRLQTWNVVSSVTGLSEIYIRTELDWFDLVRGILGHFRLGVVSNFREDTRSLLLGLFSLSGSHGFRR